MRVQPRSFYIDTPTENPPTSFHQTAPKAIECMPQRTNSLSQERFIQLRKDFEISKNKAFGYFSSFLEMYVLILSARALFQRRYGSFEQFTMYANPLFALTWSFLTLKHITRAAFAYRALHERSTDAPMESSSLYSAKYQHYQNTVQPPPPEQSFKMVNENSCLEEIIDEPNTSELSSAKLSKQSWSQWILSKKVGRITAAISGAIAGGLAIITGISLGVVVLSTCVSCACISFIHWLARVISKNYSDTHLD